MLDLNRPSLPSSLLFGAEIINRPVHYRFEWSAKDAAAAVVYQKKNKEREARERQRERKRRKRDSRFQEMSAQMNSLDGARCKRRLPALR